MAQKATPQPSTVGEKLRDAISEKGMTIRGFARLRAKQAVGLRREPTFNEVESKRRQLNGWLDDSRTISDPFAEQLARDLDKPADYFKTPRKPRTRRREELAEIRDRLARIDDALAGLAELRDRFDDLEARLAPPTDDSPAPSRPSSRRR